MSTFSERLVAQSMKLHQRSLELEMEVSRMEGKKTYHEELEKRLEGLIESLKTVEQRRSALEQQNKESEAAFERAKDTDNEERTALSAVLKERIDAIQALTEEVGEKERKAQSDNRRLQGQLEVYEQHSSTNEDKYADIMSDKSEEVQRLKDRQLKDAERVPIAKQLLAEEMAARDIAKAEQDELQGKVDVYLARFGDIQKQLTAAKASYDEAKSEKNRLIGRLRSLDTDRQLMVSRAQKSRQERDKELAKVTQTEEKVELLKTQIEKLNNVIQMLTSDEAVPVEK